MTIPRRDDMKFADLAGCPNCHSAPDAIGNLVRLETAHAGGEEVDVSVAITCGTCQSVYLRESPWRA